jgi:hypothetical protein
MSWNNLNLSMKRRLFPVSIQFFMVIAYIGVCYIPLLFTYEAAFAADWPTFKDPSSGITMQCPNGWAFMKPSEVRSKTKGQMNVPTSTLVFCVNKKNPDQNINVQFTGNVGDDAPNKEAAKKLLASMDGNITSRMQGQLDGFKKELSRISDIAGGAALELFYSTSRNDTIMKQRLIILIAKRKAFTITCTSPRSLFSGTNSTVFDRFTSSIAVQ